MNIIAQIFTLLVVFFLAKYVFRDAPKKYANFGALLIVGVLLVIPFVIPGIALAISYAVLVVAGFLMLFFMFALFGETKFAKYMQGGDTKYWIVIATFLIAAFAASQVIGETLLQEEVITGDSIKNYDQVAGENYLEQIFIFIIGLSLLITITKFLS